MVVCERRELDQNLTDHADARLFDRATGQFVKVLYDSADNATVFAHGRISLGDCLGADGAPLLVELLRAAGHHFVGAGRVEAAHHDIAVDGRLNRLDGHGNRDLKARILLHVAYVYRDNRDVPHARFLEGAADKADVVRSAAAAAGLTHEDGGVV